jgi:hypothetical protein
VAAMARSSALRREPSLAPLTAAIWCTRRRRGRVDAALPAAAAWAMAPAAGVAGAGLPV